MFTDPQLIEAELALGYIHLRELALLAISSGLDGPNIARLAAADDCPSAYEKEIVLPRAMLEMGLTAIPILEATLRVAAHRVREIVENRCDPLKFTGELERLWIASGYSDVLQSLGTLDDALWLGRSLGETEERIRERMFENIRQFLRANPKTCD